jgi:hypothetical protein
MGSKLDRKNRRYLRRIPIRQEREQEAKRKEE